MSEEQILVVGASGRIGRALVQILTVNGSHPRALVRNPSDQDEFIRSGVDAVRGDLNNPLSVARAVANINRLFTVTRDDPRQAVMEGGLFRAAVAAGVRHIVKVSAFAAGLHPPVGYGVTHAESEAALRSCGVRWTILRPFMFMQNFLDLSSVVAGPGIIPLPCGRAPISLIDARDLARVAYSVLNSDEYFGRTLELTGPEPLQISNCAKILSTVLRRRIRYVNIPSFAAYLLMRAQGIDRWNATMRKDLFSMLRAGGEAHVTDTVLEVTGSPPIDLKCFFQEHANAFSPSG